MAGEGAAVLPVSIDGSPNSLQISQSGERFSVRWASAIGRHLPPGACDICQYPAVQLGKDQTFRMAAALEEPHRRAGRIRRVVNRNAVMRSH